jgi:D-arabinose 1-dehydrogenase-like Zn-dependent alcohol dehydrogenase
MTHHYREKYKTEEAKAIGADKVARMKDQQMNSLRDEYERQLDVIRSTQSMATHSFNQQLRVSYYLCVHSFSHSNLFDVYLSTE